MTMLTQLGIFVLIYCLQPRTSVEGSPDIFALGLSIGFIKNKQLKASSVYQGDHVQFGASQARLHLFSGWCANELSGNEWRKVWHQVDFNKPVNVIGIGLQGHRETELMNEFVTSFYMQMSNSSYSDSFQNITNSQGNTVIFEGVKDHKKAVYRWLDFPVKARLFRFRAKEISGTRICARLEYFGYGTNTGKVGSKDLYPLGMVNYAIKDDQVSFNSKEGSSARLARLNRDGKLAWCSEKEKYPSQWIQIDFKYLAVVTAIATQGDWYGDHVANFVVAVGNDSSSLNVLQNSSGNNKIFLGNTATDRNIPNLQFFEEPITARFVRVIPTATTSKEGCMKLELFGYKVAPNQPIYPYGFSALQEITDKALKTTSAVPRLQRLDSYCLSSTTDSLHVLNIQLTKPLAIAGVAIQGHPRNSSWVELFDITLLNKSGLAIKNYQALSGGRDNMIIAYHWFKDSILASRVQIRPISWRSQPCLRFQLYGKLELDTPLLNITSNVTRKEGSQLTVLCLVPNYPESLLKWEAENRRQLENGSFLYFQNISRKDAGTYTCTARHPFLQLEQKTQKFELKVPYRDPLKLNTSYSTEINEGKSLIVYCRVNSFPPTDQLWLDATNNRTLSYTPWLILSPVSRNDSGTYTCRSTSYYFGPTNISFLLAVRYLDKLTINVKGNTTKMEGKSLTVQCNVSSFPSATLIWERQNQTNVVNGSILVIQNISRSDAGKYSCVAKQPNITTKRKDFVLSVYYFDNPIINATNNMVRVEGADLIVQCTSSSFPAAVLAWENQKRKRIANGSILMIQNISRSDAGNYSCVAIHLNITAKQKEFHLIVNSRNHCSNTFCQNKGLCETTAMGARCRCKISFYGNYCELRRSILQLQLVVKLKETSTDKQLNGSETESLLGTHTSESYAATIKGIEHQVESAVMRAENLKTNFLEAKINEIRFSTLYLTLHLFFQNGVNQTILTIQQSLNKSLEKINFNFTLPHTPFIEYLIDPAKVKVNDYDECSHGSDSCPAKSSCHNIPFSYHCLCIDGFVKRDNVCKKEQEAEASSKLETLTIVSGALAGIIIIILAILMFKIRKRCKACRVKNIVTPE